MNSTDTPKHYSEMVDKVEAMSDEDLEKELSFAEGFGVGPKDDESVAVWLEALRHESRCRGVFIPSVDYATIEEWMRDSDYFLCDDENCHELGDGACGWVDLVDQPVEPTTVYAEAHQSMTWSDALDSVLKA